jgi:hypothetical protein
MYHGQKPFEGDLALHSLTGGAVQVPQSFDHFTI